jgi:hypothetical protein
MLTAEQIVQFHRDGYLRIPNVLTPEQVGWLRTFFQTKLDRPPQERLLGDLEDILVEIHARYPEVKWLLFHQPTINILKSLLGDDFVVLRESAVQLNRFGGWHKDTSSQEKAGRTFHWDDSFLMIEAAYYLQDNSEEYGGGLDVEPGSHLKPDQFIGDGGRLQSAWRKASRLFTKQVSIPSKAGDLVLFHFRINHRATRPRQAEAANERRKLAIFFACSRNNHHIGAYYDFLTSRPEYGYLKEVSCPQGLLEEAAAMGIRLM